MCPDIAKGQAPPTREKQSGMCPCGSASGIMFCVKSRDGICCSTARKDYPITHGMISTKTETMKNSSDQNVS